MTFAATGGDGVHFGMVEGANQYGCPGPIVMTVPMASKENVIVAEGLDEFFSLGYYAGWDGLDQIVYQLDYALACYPGPNEDMSKEQMAFLGLIRNEFGTKHIPLTKKRLDELEKHYFSKLDVGGLDEWEAQF